jgi:hypothetical protein
MTCSPDATIHPFPGGFGDGTGRITLPIIPVGLGKILLVVEFSFLTCPLKMALKMALLCPQALRVWRRLISSLKKLTLRV